MAKTPPRKLLLATATATALFLGIGAVFYDHLLADFFAANVGSARNVYREEPIRWAVLLAQSALGTLVALACAYVPSVTSTADGLRLGAIVGLLAGVGFSFDMYGVTNVANLSATIVDALIWIVRGAAAGAVATWLLDRR